MDGASIVTTIVTVLSSATGTLVVKSIIDGIRMAKSGVSGREDKRNASLIEQRDHALRLAADAEQGEALERERRVEAERQAAAAEVRADLERELRRRAQEELSRARRTIFELGSDPGPWPNFDDTEPGR